jgi:hypothetical protein
VSGNPPVDELVVVDIAVVVVWSEQEHPGMAANAAVRRIAAKAQADFTRVH